MRMKIVVCVTAVVFLCYCTFFVKTHVIRENKFSFETFLLSSIVCHLISRKRAKFKYPLHTHTHTHIAN